MDGILHDIECLKKAVASLKSKSTRQIQETADKLSSTLVLLDTSSPSSKAFDKLDLLLRKPMLPLYIACSRQAITLTASILKKIFNELHRILEEPGSIKEDVKHGWERVANSLVSGVVEFLDVDATNEKKTLIGDLLYPPLCQLLFPQSANWVMSIDAALRGNGYMLISASASHHVSNQTKLRVGKLLGAEKLGHLMFETKEYTALETLLMIFAKLLPPSSPSKAKRDSFIRQTFSSRKGMNEEKLAVIMSLLDGIGRKNWEDTVSKLFDQISATDISFPQPFNVDNVTVCGIDFPQPDSSDRFYVDQKALFINSQQEDGMYDSLQIAFETITTITMSTSGDITTVNFSMSSIPILADKPIAKKDSNPPMSLTVKIAKQDVSRFTYTLKDRNMKMKVARLEQSTGSLFRVSITDPARLDLADDEVASETSEMTSQKAQEIQNFYGSSDAFDSSVKQTEETSKAVSVVVKDRQFDNAASRISKVQVKSIDCSSEEVDHLRIPKGNEATGRNEKVAETSLLEPLRNNAKDSDDQPTFVSKQKKKRPTPKKNGRIVISDEESNSQVIEGSTTPQDASRKYVCVELSKCEKKKSEKSKKSKNIPGKRAPLKPAFVNQKLRGADTDSNTDADKMSRADGGKSKEEDTLPSDADEVKENTTEPVRSRRAKRASAVAAAAKLAVQEKFDNELDPINESDTLMEQLKAVDHPRKKDPKPVSICISSSPMGESHKEIEFGQAYCDARREPSVVQSEAREIPAKRSLPDDGEQKEHATETPRPVNITHHEESAQFKKRRIDQKPKVQTPARQFQKPKRHENAVQITLAKPIDETDWDEVPEAPPLPKSRTLALVKETIDAKAKNEKNKREEKRKEKISSGRPTPHNPKISKPISNTNGRNRAPLAEIFTVAKGNVDQNMKAKNQGQKPAPSDSPGQNNVDKNPSARPSMAETDSRESTVIVGTTLVDILLKGARVKDDDMITEAIEIPEPTSAPTDDIPVQLMDVDDFPQLDCAEEDVHHDTLPIERVRKVQQPTFERLHAASTTPFLDTELLGTTTQEHKPSYLDIIDLTQDTGELSKQKSSPMKQLQKKPPMAMTINSTKDNARSRVKFDDRLHFKSASFDGLPARQRMANENDRKDTRIRIRHIQEQTSRKDEQQSEVQRHRWSKEPGMTEIINVLDSIHEAIIDNIANRSKEVRSDIRAARNLLLDEATEDLVRMREESIAHLNKMSAIETEYANFGRTLCISYEKSLDANRDMCDLIRQAIARHDRESISKKVDRSFFSSRLPPSITKWTQQPGAKFPNE